MSGGERRLASQRGELNGTRENQQHIRSTLYPTTMRRFGPSWITRSSGKHYDDPTIRLKSLKCYLKKNMV